MDANTHPVGHDADAVEQPVSHAVAYLNTAAERDPDDLAVAKHSRRRTLDHAGAELAAAAAAVDGYPICTLHAIADAHRIRPDHDGAGEHGDIDALSFAYTHRSRPGRSDD